MEKRPINERKKINELKKLQTGRKKLWKLKNRLGKILKGKNWLEKNLNP